MTISQKIFELRNNAKLSQIDLSEKIGVSRQSISKWETGASLPDLDKLILISKLFNVSMDFLVNDELDFTKKESTENEFLVNLNTEQKAITPRHIFGFIFLGIGVVMILVHIILSVFFLGLGLACLLIKKYCALKIMWALLILFAITSSAFMGVSFSVLAFRFMRPISIAISVSIIIVFLLLSWRTIIKFKTKKSRILTGACCYCVYLLHLITGYIFALFVIPQEDMQYFLSPVAILQQCLNLLIIIIVSILSVRHYLKAKN